MLVCCFKKLCHKRFLITVASVFAFMWVTDFLIHQILLKDMYQETASMWRSPEEIQSHMPFMFLGQFLTTFFFVWIFSKNYEGRGIGEGVRFGALIGALFASPLLVEHAVSPLPTQLLMYWGASCFVQKTLAGIVCALVYRAPEGEHTHSHSHSHGHACGHDHGHGHHHHHPHG